MLSRYLTKRCAGSFVHLLGSEPEWAQVADTVTNLSLLPAGTVGAELEGGLDPETLVKQLQGVGANHDYVVLDLPPVTDVESVARLREQCEGMMLVLEANRTRRQVATYLVRALSEGPGAELALVLNKRDFPIPTWLYARL